MQTKVNNISSTVQFKTLVRLVMATMLLALLFRLSQNALPHQFLSPPMFGLGLEMPFRLYKFLHIDDLIVSSAIGSLAFTFILFIMTILCLLYPEKNRLFPLFSIIYFLYYLSYDTFKISHGHDLTAMVWVTIPFWAMSTKNRWMLWDGMRYYACFIYAISFVYKITGGSLFEWNNGVNSVMDNTAYYLYQHPDTLASGILSFTIAHPVILNTGHLAVMIAEGLMFIGFFTKKYDRWLLLVPVLVHGSTYLFSDVYFIDFLVMIFLFLDDKQVAWIQRKIPVLAK